MYAEAQQGEDGGCNQYEFPVAQMQTQNFCNYRCPLLICAFSLSAAYGSAEEGMRVLALCTGPVSTLPEAA